MVTSRLLRVGAVTYLNTRPLVCDLPRLAPHVQLLYDLPSRLADRLAAGQLDVALIPTTEVFRHPEYRIVSDACIACRGPVLSVKLLCRRPISSIRDLALDEGSRTSAVLAQILLRERAGVRPRLRGLPIGSGLDDTAADAVLLIGDRAMHASPAGFAEVWDLGDQWCRWSELPMVFALWAARPGVDLGDLASALGAARDKGVAGLASIARCEAPRVGLAEPQCLAYLRDNLHFVLGPPERQGLELFYRLARQHELVPAGWKFSPADCPDDCPTAR